jgi:hypothetical protein
LRRRERDRPHRRHDVLPQKHKNDIGESPKPLPAQASLERGLLADSLNSQ